MIFEACKKFKINQQRTPIYLLARSFGGLIATNMLNTTIGRSMITGVILLTPFYRLFTERLYDSENKLRLLSWFAPYKKFYSEFSEKPEWYKEEYKLVNEDQKALDFFTAKTALIWIEEQRKALESIKQAPQPICFIAAGGDGVVRNDYIEQFSQLAQDPDQLNEYHEVPDADHMIVVLDKNYSSHVIRASQGFLEKLTVRREAQLEAQLIRSQGASSSESLIQQQL